MSGEETEEERIIYLEEEKGTGSSGGFPGEEVGDPWVGGGMSTEL